MDSKMFRFIRLVIVYCIVTYQITIEGLPLTIEISHYEPALGEPVKQTIHLNDNIAAEFKAIIEPKSDSFKVTEEDDGEYEWDCAAPFKPDIITEVVQLQTRKARDLLATNDAIDSQSQPTIVQTTVRGINDAALNLMHYTFAIFNTIIPSNKN